MTLPLKITVTDDSGKVFISPNYPPFYNVNIWPDGNGADFGRGGVGSISKTTNSNVKPFKMGKHHVKIEDGATVLFDSDIAQHYWGARWTWRRNQFVIKDKPADIIANRREFPFGQTVIPAPKIGIKSPFTKPFDYGDWCIYMPTTGFRPDLERRSDWDAMYMLFGDTAPMLSQAQAAASFPEYVRNEVTGKFLDLTQFPQANMYDQPDRQGAPWLPKGPFDVNPDGSQGYSRFDGPATSQQAHHPSFGYLAWQATKDPGFLDTIQGSANFTLFTDASKSLPTGAIPSGELRGLAWAFRNLLDAYAATKDAEALGLLMAWQMPSSYFLGLLTNALAYYDKFRADQQQSVFRVFAGGTRFGPWQQDYMLGALAFAVLIGLDQFKPLYLWALGNVIARTNGTSGYPPCLGAYYLNLYPFKTDPDTGKLTNVPDETKPQFTWHESAWYCMAIDPDGNPTPQSEIDKIAIDQYYGGKALVGYEYLMGTRQRLVEAAWLQQQGYCDVLSAYPELYRCIATVETMFKNGGGNMNPRNSVVLDSSKVPTDIGPVPPTPPLPTMPPADPFPEPPPPDQPPPQGDHHMKTFADLTADVHAMSSVADSAKAAINALVARLKAMAAAAAGAGTQIDPAAIDALALELETHAAPLSAAIANVPPAS